MESVANQTCEAGQFFSGLEHGLSKLSVSQENHSDGVDLRGFFTDSENGSGCTDAEDGVADDEWECSQQELLPTKVLKRKQIRKKLGSGSGGGSSSSSRYSIIGASAVSGYPASPLSGMKDAGLDKNGCFSASSEDFYNKNMVGGSRLRRARARRNFFRNKDDLRERAWQRRRDQVQLHYSEDSNQSDLQSSCGEEAKTPRLSDFTNVDLDELKGCLDLGFGFNYDEIPEFSHTLPALELCYAMGQQILADEHLHKSPTSPLECIADSSTSDGYAQSPTANWTISNPGDHPQDVKARLKVWAQAVACTVRLCN